MRRGGLEYRSRSRSPVRRPWATQQHPTPKRQPSPDDTALDEAQEELGRTVGELAMARKEIEVAKAETAKARQETASIQSKANAKIAETNRELAAAKALLKKAYQ